MFISNYERETLQKKVESLSVLLTQALERAQKSEEKITELSSKILGIEDLQIQQQLKLVEVIEEIEEIDGLSDEIIERIKNCDSRAEAVEKHVALRYRDHDDMEKHVKFLLNASNDAASDIQKVERRLDNFVDIQNANSAKVKEQIKMLDNEQKAKNEKIVNTEKGLLMTRGVLFALKDEVAANKKDLHNFRKIAAIREEPVFVLDGGNTPPKEVAVKKRKTRSTIGIILGPLVKTPEAPYGLKKDGTPRKRPGRPMYNIPEIKNEQPLPV
jgi:HD superfamily phosphohydrolase